MTLTLIAGGKQDVPEHRRGTLTDLERARSDVINRVAAAIHMANTEDIPGYPTWEWFVDEAYANADTNPKMLESVSNTITAARAAIEAMRPCAPQWDEAIFIDIGGDPGEVCAAVQDFIDGVLK